MGSGAWGCGTHPHVPTACSTQVPNINPADTGKKLRALPVVLTLTHRASTKPWTAARLNETPPPPPNANFRSEEHTSELQSQSNLVCRLLLEKKKAALPRVLRRLDPSYARRT